MKNFLLTVVALLVLVNSARSDDQVPGDAGTTAFVTIGTAVTVTTLKRPVFRDVIGSLSVEPGLGSSPSVIIAGRMVDDNAGAGQEFVPIFFGSSLYHPRLAALSDVDGAFRIRVWLVAKPSGPPLHSRQTVRGSDKNVTIQSLSRASGAGSRFSIGYPGVPKVSLSATDLSSSSLYLGGAFNGKSDMLSSYTNVYSLGAFLAKTAKRKNSAPQ